MRKVNKKLETNEFLADLKFFHQYKGQQFHKAPRLNGREIDLCALYYIVTGLGGWKKVGYSYSWEKVATKFWGKCSNLGFGLKQIYLKYLAEYEKDNFVQKHDDDIWSKGTTAKQTVSAPYIFQSEEIKPSVYEKLNLSLISPLPNEHDFAINVLSLLSCDSEKMTVAEDAKVLYHLLAHAGVFKDLGLKALFKQYYDIDREHLLCSFWRNITDDSILFEDGHPVLKSLKMELPTSESGYKFFDPFILQRVELVAKIVLNFSCNLSNALFMSTDETFFKFVLLCSASNCETLQELGWEIITNVSEYLDDKQELTDILVRQCLRNLYSEKDRVIYFTVNILTELTKSIKAVLLKYLGDKELNIIYDLLSKNNIDLLISVLDFYYSFSFLGREFCDILLSLPCLMDTLVALMSVGVTKCEIGWKMSTYQNQNIYRNKQGQKYFVFESKTNKLSPCKSVKKEPQKRKSTEKVTFKTPPAPRPLKQDSILLSALRVKAEEEKRTGVIKLDTLVINGTPFETCLVNEKRYIIARGITATPEPVKKVKKDVTSELEQFLVFKKNSPENGYSSHSSILPTTVIHLKSGSSTENGPKEPIENGIDKIEKNDKESATDYNSTKPELTPTLKMYMKYKNEAPPFLKPNYIEPEDTNDQQGKAIANSIRLTAALILRNLSLHSPKKCQRLNFYETYLLEIALTNNELSSYVLNVLGNLKSC